MTWDLKSEKTLTSLWDSGMKTGSIAEMMGITKNSVIGKARRMGLDMRNPKNGYFVRRRRKRI